MFERERIVFFGWLGKKMAEEMKYRRGIVVDKTVSVCLVCLNTRGEISIMVDDELELFLGHFYTGI